MEAKLVNCLSTILPMLIAAHDPDEKVKKITINFLIRKRRKTKHPIIYKITYENMILLDGIKKILTHFSIMVKKDPTLNNIKHSTCTCEIIA